MDRSDWMKKIDFFIMCLIVGMVILILYKGVDNYFNKKLEDDFINNNELREKYDFYENDNFMAHNTSERNKKIEYIVIHYTGTEMSAKSFVNFYNSQTSKDASADYFVDFNGDVYQYNIDVDNRFSWAVAGDKVDNQGGSLYKTVTNENSVSIELCVKSNGARVANQSGWQFSKNTIESAVLLVKNLMEKYDISSDNVIRHYDVNGKLCPGVIGWNEDSGSEKNWIDFKSKLEES